MVKKSATCLVRSDWSIGISRGSCLNHRWMLLDPTAALTPSPSHPNPNFPDPLLSPDPLSPSRPRSTFLHTPKRPRRHGSVVRIATVVLTPSRRVQPLRSARLRPPRQRMRPGSHLRVGIGLSSSSASPSSSPENIAVQPSPSSLCTSTDPCELPVDPPPLPPRLPSAPVAD